MNSCRLETTARKPKQEISPIDLVQSIHGAQAMSTQGEDHRSPSRKALDEQIAAEPPLPPLDLPPDAPSSSMETHLGQRGRRPIAVAGVVANGLVRPLDPGVHLPEHARVIIVASE